MANAGWSILWFLVFVIFSFCIAFLTAWWYIVISAFAPCCRCLQASFKKITRRCVFNSFIYKYFVASSGFLTEVCPAPKLLLSSHAGR